MVPSLAGQALSNAYFGVGSGQIWLDNVACTSSDTELIACSSNAIGVHDCTHSDDASVRCEGNAK